MSSGHDHSHHKPTGSRNILVAFFLNFLFAIIEFIGGYYTNSMAIISDAVHDAGDSLALLFSYYSDKVSKKPANRQFTYGHGRYSILGALVNGIILFIGSLFVLKEAIERLQAPEVVKPEGMVLLAILGVIINSFAAYRLSRDDGINQKMVMYHLLEDILGWISVLIVSVVLLFKPWFILDSILSILISLIILRGVYGNLKKITEIIMQKFPENIDLQEIENSISSFDKVLGVHSVKGWSIDNRTSTVTMHILVPEDMLMKDVDVLKQKVLDYLHDYGLQYVTLQIESSSVHCSLC